MDSQVPVISPKDKPGAAVGTEGVEELSAEVPCAQAVRIKTRATAINERVGVFFDNHMFSPC